MSAQLLDGRVLALQLKQQLQGAIEDLRNVNKTVSVVSITFGQDSGASSYLKSQRKITQELGIQYREINFSEVIQQEDLLNHIKQINKDYGVHGVIINKPLPSYIDYSLIINHLDPAKDIEGLGERNLGRLLLGKNSLVPCTAAAALALLKSCDVNLKGKEALVIGRSEIVGKPMALLLLKQDMTVTVCHSKTRNIEEHVNRADVVVAALGQKRFVQGDWIKEGAIVIDVGINDDNGKIVGDVDFDACFKKASFITPVPGGVGPITSVMLMKNALEAYAGRPQVSIERAI